MTGRKKGHPGVEGAAGGGKGEDVCEKASGNILRYTTAKKCVFFCVYLFPFVLKGIFHHSLNKKRAFDCSD